MTFRGWENRIFYMGTFWKMTVTHINILHPSYLFMFKKSIAIDAVHFQMTFTSWKNHIFSLDYFSETKPSHGLPY